MKGKNLISQMLVQRLFDNQRSKGTKGQDRVAIHRGAASTSDHSAAGYASQNLSLNRAQGVHRVRGGGAGCGKRRRNQRHQQHDQNPGRVDQRVSRADFEEERTDKA